MNNNKISNPKTEVPKGTKLNDKDYANELLSCLKEMSKNLGIVKTEASNESLYNEYKEMCEEIFTLQRKVYEFMFKNGWYELEKAEKDKINEKYNMLNQEFTNLNESA